MYYIYRLANKETNKECVESVNQYSSSQSQNTTHSNYISKIDISIAFLPLKLSSFFSCKDTLPKSLQSYVVYQFTCAGSKACYIGETKRHLNTRIEEHLGRIKNLIYIHTSKKIHNAKKELISIVLKLQIVLLLILGYKSRRQCILIGKNPSSTNRLST